MDSNIVTAVGMLLAFLTAFLAEPVKNRFEKKNKLRELKKSLYTELLLNYHALDFPKDKIDSNFVNLTVHFKIRTEVYSHTLQDEWILFYQLQESPVIGELYNSFLIPYQKAIDKNENISMDIQSYLPESSQNFCSGFVMYFYGQRLDTKLLSQLVSKGEYNEIIRRGKEEWTKYQPEINEIRKSHNL